jgi:hypothetical protein
MSNIRSIARSISIDLSDESIIDLDLSITIATSSSGCIANDQINSDSIGNILEAIQLMLITSLGKSAEEIDEMAGEDGN